MTTGGRDALGLLVAGLTEFIAPSRCLGCLSREDAIWCQDCYAQVQFNEPSCSRCATVGARLHACIPVDIPIAATVAAYQYDGPVAAAIRTAKLAGAHAAWPHLAKRLADRVAIDVPDVDLVTWVTTPAKRARRRGGDHAEAIANVVSGRTGVPSIRLLDARATRNGDSYRYGQPWSLHGATVALADDVVTTAATVIRAARVLADAGAGRIVVCAIARADGRR
ncbi:MAG: hypothetical protein WD576_03120 [Nitriliruptoraceae bacterium]